MTASADQAPGPPPAIQTRNLGWAVFKNSAAQAVGRVLIALARLVVVAFIVRGAGSATFAEYSLLFGILTLAEWIVDFGTTDVFVREICREPEKGQRLLRVLTAARVIQVPLAILAVAGFLLALRYPMRVVEAGMVGAMALIFFGGVLVYRVVFKATLTMEREMAAELASVLLIIPVVWWVLTAGGGLTALLACHLLSRAIYFAICFAFGRTAFRPSIRGVSRDEVRWALGMSLAIGVSGLLVVFYETVDLILLSRLSTLNDLAYFSAARRFVWPVLMTQAAIGATLYAVAASYWPKDRDRFEASAKRAVDSVFLVGGIAISAFVAGAAFIMGLLGNEMVAGSDALRILALICLVKAIVATLGPLLYVVHAQKAVLWVVSAAVVVKTVASAILAARYGYLGVAWGSVVIDLVCLAIPSVWLIRRYAGLQIRWRIPLRVLALSAVSAGAGLLAPGPPIVPALTAPIVFALLVAATRTVDMADLRSLLPRRA